MGDFGAYIPEEERGSRERYEAWSAAIGLQAVDGLRTSEYLQATAARHVAGDITIDEARRLICGYYESREARENRDEDGQEADKVAANIAKLLGEDAFSFCPAAIWETHQRIFEGVFKHAGQSRSINNRKKEWVLDGRSVAYSPVELIQRSVEYDMERERGFDYSAADMEGTVNHLAEFVSGLWQIHPFQEGNTRTMAVFLIRYLRNMGFVVDNTQFERHSWYFRNALVRANYQNRALGIVPDKSFLVLFLRNLFMGMRNELKKRNLHIYATEASSSSEQVTEQATEQVADPSRRLLVEMSGEPVSVRQLMSQMGLKHRPSFMQNYLHPAIQAGLVRRMYEQQEKHPRQRYLLTSRGIRAKSEMLRKEACASNPKV